MLISCENCLTKYNVNPIFIGLNGRKVKCIACKHVWQANLPEEERKHIEQNSNDSISKIASNMRTEYVDELSNTENKKSKNKIKNLLPAIVNRQVPLWLKIMPIPVSTLALGIYLVFYSHSLTHYVPYLSSVYKHFGIYDIRGMKLQDISLQKLKSDGEHYDIVVRGIILNTTKNTRLLPGIRLSVLNSKGENIISSVSNSDGSTLGEGESFNINNKITNLDQSAKYISVDIGNHVDLLLR